MGEHEGWCSYGRVLDWFSLNQSGAQWWVFGQLSGFLTAHSTGNCWHCTALHWLYCSLHFCTALHPSTLHFTALPCTSLHCPALHCTALHCWPLQGGYHLGQFWSISSGSSYHLHLSTSPAPLIPLKPSQCRSTSRLLVKLDLLQPPHTFPNTSRLSSTSQHCTLKLGETLTTNLLKLQNNPVWDGEKNNFREVIGNKTNHSV